MKYFSMFSGIGGFELGIQRAFDGQSTGRFGQEESISESDKSNTSRQSNERQHTSCVGYSEIDKYAIKVYERNFGNELVENATSENTQPSKQKPEGGGRFGEYAASDGKRKGHTNYGDATTINAKELPDFDLLVGGFPCQAFSVAGKRKGFDDTRGTLFFEIARILAEKRPRHLVLENVKGLLSHDGGKTFQTILGVLSDLGYRVEWQVLNSKDFGVPQNRERIYIVGHLRGECSRQVFPIIGTNGEDTRNVGEDVAYTIDANYHKGTNTLDKSRRSLVAVKEATKQGYDIATEGDSINYTQPNSKTRRGRVGKGVANTLDTASTQGTIDGSRIRRLTPLECERLQGFPDDWTEFGVSGDSAGLEKISDTQRYKMCGNAVTVNVVEAVMRKIFSHV